MLPFETFVTFAAAAGLLALAPGPDNIFVLTQSALNGVRSGLWVVLGLATGLVLHALAVALGLAAVLQTSAVAFTVIKLIGAGYLLYLAYQAFRAPAQAIGNDAPRQSALALYRRGFIMNITNPKVAIFFLAFFPQFTDPALGGLVWQVAQLGALFICVMLIVFGSIAILAGGLSEKMRSSPAVQLWMNRVAGLVFVGLAVKIATTRQ